MAIDSTNDERSGFRQWLDRRTGLDSLLHHALDEPIPGGAKIAYIFGSGLLFLFLSQVITGVFLAMYYVPSADHAHTTVAYITKEVTGGSFLRSIHAYGSSAIIIVLLLHLTQTFLYGSYKGHRELVWLAGCVLLALMLGMAFRVSAALGPESLLRDNCGYQHPERSSKGGKCAKETAAGRNRDGDTHAVKIFRAARVPDPRVHFCTRR